MFYFLIYCFHDPASKINFQPKFLSSLATTIESVQKFRHKDSDIVKQCIRGKNASQINPKKGRTKKSLPNEALYLKLLKTRIL